MKSPLTFLFVLASLSFVSTQGNAQVEKRLTGAWQTEEGGQKEVLLFQDGYFTHTVYTDQAFLYSYGGPYKVVDGYIDVDVEFNSREAEGAANPLRKMKTDFDLSGNQLSLKLEGKRANWERIDDSDAPLAGIWQITDRMEGENIVPIQRTGTRKTLKMLTGTRFQWFAIDPATRLFAGSGGGTYTFKDGKYTENIDVFSRDNNRVGASLVFDGKLEDGKWHHSGLSSKGDKIYEIWGRVK